jgi:enoyl-CoA hydratase/carnithine racemase
VWHKTAEEIMTKVRQGGVRLHQIKTATDTSESRGARGPARRIVQLVDGGPGRGLNPGVVHDERLLNKSFQMSLDQALEHERVAAGLKFSSEDGQEAARASREKRTPIFRGR